MAERITFVEGAMRYHSMLAAEHLSRYALAAPACVGKRVLDIACGEGYGSAFLKDRGAASVTGVDISEEAISNAKRRFGQNGAKFKVGDALDSSSWHSGSAYDAIVCFETIEHVSSPERLLEILRDLLAPNGILLISCPNDAIEAQRGIENPFHTRVFSLSDFKEITSRVLGRAEQWLIATPLTGIAILDENDSRLTNSDTSMMLTLMGAPLPRTLTLPAQSEHCVSADSASFFLGIWNARAEPTQVSAPMSRRAHLEYWFALQDQRRAIECLTTEAARASGTKPDSDERVREIWRIAEERVREIRRIAELERNQYEREYASEKAALLDQAAQLRAIQSSRAHQVADFYIRKALGPSLLFRVLRVIRSFVGALARTVHLI